MILVPNRPTAFLMVGIPGAGKSTWIANNLPLDIPIISRDIIRAELGFTTSADEKKVLSTLQEQEVTRLEDDKIQELSAKGKSFVIDDTNTGRYRKKMIKNLHSYGMKVVGIYIDTPIDICIARRQGQIPEQDMQRIYAKLRPLLPDEVDEIINVTWGKEEESGVE